GLSALLGDMKPEAAPVAHGAVAGVAPPPRGVRAVPVGHIVPGTYQPRRDFDKQELDELVASIKAQGVLQPILVRKHPSDHSKFELIAGERRWRAAQVAQLHEIPALVRDFSDREALEAALVENLQRTDLNALEEAIAYRRLIDEFGHTQDQVATGLGKSRPYIANMVRLLDLPQEVQALLRDKALSPGHARLLVGLPNALELAKQIVTDKMTVREAEAFIGSFKEQTGKAKKKKHASTSSADTRALERTLTEFLGLRVVINSKGKAGSITIHYQSLDQLDELLTRITGAPKV
ncbi:MAG TPA: ParB/RepB/Spo0J family partition protein, partial [Alphaproteobacteria bacterium]|nr:ParB/RepB/Spo0J family partition protein [Alphaproteobacteria bacterium]